MKNTLFALILFGIATFGCIQNNQLQNQGQNQLICSQEKIYENAIGQTNTILSNENIQTGTLEYSKGYRVKITYSNPYISGISTAYLDNDCYVV